jgi:hypothetical protein
VREKLNPLRCLSNDIYEFFSYSDDISEFRARLKSAIQRYRNFHLDRWTPKPGILSDEHPPLLQPLVMSCGIGQLGGNALWMVGCQ